MKFGPVPLDDALGKILVHNVTADDGRRALRKGSALTERDVATLRELGRRTVYVVALEPGDVGENEAAGRVAQALLRPWMRLRGPSTGRCNLHTTTLGLVRVDVARLRQLNGFEGITLATLSNHTPVTAGRMIATLKILPYAIGEPVVAAAEALVGSTELLRVDPLPPRRVALLLSGSVQARARVVKSFESALAQRLRGLNADLVEVDFVPLEEETDEAVLAARLRAARAARMDLVILAGETAITDRHDIAPRAVERAGGTVIGFGAPVDPGNLLMLAYLDEMPVVGAPGCARSPKENIVDLVLPRVLAGDRLTRRDIIEWGHGGLLEDVPERPFPRGKIE